MTDNSLWQTILIDLYWYKNYNWEELTEDFLNNWEYEKGIDFLQGKFFKEDIENFEKNWGLATEMFVKIRILRDNPMFQHLLNGGLVKIVKD